MNQPRGFTPVKRIDIIENFIMTVAYLEVDRTTLKSKTIIKVVKKRFFFTLTPLKNNFNDFSSLLPHMGKSNINFRTKIDIKNNIENIEHSKLTTHR